MAINPDDKPGGEYNPDKPKLDVKLKFDPKAISEDGYVTLSTQDALLLAANIITQVAFRG